MMKIIIPLFSLLFLKSLIVAQFDTVSVELNVDRFVTPSYTFVNEDVIVNYYSKKLKKTIIKRFDKDLKLIYSNELEVISGFTRDIYVDENNVHFLFYNYNSGIYQIATYNLEDNNIKISPTLILAKKKLPSFIVYGNNAYIWYVNNRLLIYEAVLYKSSLLEEKQQIIKLKSKTANYPILTFHKNPILKVLEIVNYCSSKEDKKIEILSFDSEGNEMKRTNYKELDGEIIRSVDTRNLDVDKRLIGGRCSSTPLSYKSNSKTGFNLFLAKYNKKSLVWLKHYDLMMFKSFIGNDNGLKAAKEKYYNKNKARIEIVYDKNLDGTYMLLHKLIVLKDTYIVVGEVGRKSYGINKDGVSVYKGYKYSHAFVLGFSKTSGKKLWEHSINMNVEIATKYFESQLEISKEEENIILLNPLLTGYEKIKIDDHGMLAKEIITPPSTLRPYYDERKLIFSKNWNNSIFKVEKIYAKKKMYKYFLLKLTASTK